MEIEIMLLEDLPEEQKLYLLDLEQKGGVSEIPVYYRNDSGDVFFIEDYILRDNKTFEKTAPAGLYRGGALLKLVTEHGQVVLYDERYKWFRLVGGIARFCEGTDLFRTAVREAVVEELAVLAENEKIRLVPGGTKNLVGLSVPGWGITVESLREAGLLSSEGYFFNDANKSFEAVIRWDISGWKDLVILHSEDWFRGGRSGFTPFVINRNQELVGLYDGRHGFFPFPDGLYFPTKQIHPTLERHLGL